MDKPVPTSIESYDDALRWIHSRINYEHIRPKKSSTHFRLERTQRLLSLIDSPQRRIPAVHIAGSKGKGSTAAMIDSVLRASGICSGLFTSPHIHRFEERFKVNGSMPDEAGLTELVARLFRLLDDEPDVVDGGPTYFEVATVLGWMYFSDRQIELAVLETGLGGRLDCTNVCNPLVTIITTIGLDHTDILGNTLEKIAAEKAGIIKPGVPVVCGTTHPGVTAVIAARAAELGCEFDLLNRDFRAAALPNHSSEVQRLTVSTNSRHYADLSLPLIGEHQVRNAAVAIAAVERLSAVVDRITPTTIQSGLVRTNWPLRFEVIRTDPLIVLDAAHNPDAIAALLATLRASQWQARRRVLVFAASIDKDAAGMLRQAVTAFDDILLTRFETNPRSVSPEDLHRIVTASQPESSSRTDSLQTTIRVSPDHATALADARRLAGTGGLICVTGSIFLAAEVRLMLLKNGELAVTGALTM